MKTTRISPAIIMRVRELGETDLIVTFFTKDKGRLKGIAKGGRKSRKRFANCLDLCALSSMEYDIRKGRDLCFLQSCRLLEPFSGLRSDFSSLSLASYMIELTEILFPPGVTAPDMFELIRGSFAELASGGEPRITRLLFEAGAMALGGYRIDLDTCCRCGRPYRGEGRAVFVRESGGIACLKCGRESPSSPGLGPEAGLALRRIQDRPAVVAKDMSWSEETLGEIREVLSRHMDYRIGRRLKTAQYLA